MFQEQWRFVDCACGRGLQDDPRHADAIREFYFLPDPEHLIVTHFPLGMSSELLPLSPMGDNFRKGVGRTSVQVIHCHLVRGTLSLIKNGKKSMN